VGWFKRDDDCPFHDAKIPYEQTKVNRKASGEGPRFLRRLKATVPSRR
jgi:hypothetical protein